MTAFERFMRGGLLPPIVHGIADYLLAGALIVGALTLDLDDEAAKTIALVIGGAAAFLAVGTDWGTGIVKLVPPIVHGVADIGATVALILIPFIAGFSDDATALAFYLVLGGGGLIATLLTRFESDEPSGYDARARAGA